MKFSEWSTRKEEVMQKVAPEIRIGVLLNLVNSKIHICRMELHEATQRTTGNGVYLIQLLHGSKEIYKKFYEKNPMWTFAVQTYVFQGPIVFLHLTDLN